MIEKSCFGHFDQVTLKFFRYFLFKMYRYIFTGMGSDWPGMGKDLMTVPNFHATIARCHEHIANTDPEIDLLDLMVNSSRKKLDKTMAKFVTNTSIQVIYCSHSFCT